MLSFSLGKRFRFHCELPSSAAGHRGRALLVFVVKQRHCVPGLEQGAPENVHRETYSVFCHRSKGGSCCDAVLGLCFLPIVGSLIWFGGTSSPSDRVGGFCAGWRALAERARNGSPGDVAHTSTPSVRSGGWSGRQSSMLRDVLSRYRCEVSKDWMLARDDAPMRDAKIVRVLLDTGVLFEWCYPFQVDATKSLRGSRLKVPGHP
jgi:hypothetical protein